MHFCILFFICTAWRQLKTSYSFSISFLYFSSFNTEVRSNIHSKKSTTGSKGTQALWSSCQWTTLSAAVSKALWHPPGAIVTGAYSLLHSAFEIYKWCPGLSVINILENKSEAHNRNKLRVYYIYHHESHIPNPPPNFGRVRAANLFIKRSCPWTASIMKTSNHQIINRIVKHCVEVLLF